MKSLVDERASLLGEYIVENNATVRAAAKVVINIREGNTIEFTEGAGLGDDSIFAGTASAKDGIILDFFSGSGTTAHALFLANLEQSAKRKFILVQFLIWKNLKLQISQLQIVLCKNFLQFLEKFQEQF